MQEGYYSQRFPGEFQKTHRVEVAVVGGGMAGTACAVTAARLGLKTILLQNRYCLGGPASAECDCDADGGLISGAADWATRDARETGVIEEMRLQGEYLHENGYRNYWSQLLRDFCEQEQNLTLLLNTEVYDVKVEKARITELTARTVGSDLTHHVFADTVVDCSGDSFPGFKAGAEFRMGREAKAEFGETLAPEQSDTHTLGSSLFFRAVDVGHPIPFVPPPWACKIHDESPFINRPHKEIRKGYWWLECGGDMNTISDNEEIYRKLLAILYGIWDHIKNHGDHGADNYAINWIAGFPGKRESRRLMGDYILTEGDIVGNRHFDDAVTYGGAYLDVHPIQGFFSGNTPCGKEHGILAPGLYQIPLRCLYSHNIQNLMMAGRNISVSHVALSSTRWMATCAAEGQAVAGAAWLTRKYGINPGQLLPNHIRELQYVLYRMDHTVPGISIEDTENLCGNGSVKVTSSMALELRQPVTGENLRLDDGKPAGMSFINTNSRIETVFFRFNNLSQSDQMVKVQLVRQAKMYDFKQGEVIAEAEACVGVGTELETGFPLHANVEEGRRYYLRFEENPQIDVCVTDHYLPGVYKARMSGTWPPNGDNHNLCCRFLPEQRPFEAENLLNTRNRGGDQLSCWISDPQQGFPQIVDISFMQPRPCACVELIFDTNLDSFNIYHLQRECVRDYRLEAIQDGKTVLLEDVRGNYRRFRRHVFPGRTLEGLRVTVLATNGAPNARIFQVRAYPTAEL